MYEYAILFTATASGAYRPGIIRMPNAIRFITIYTTDHVIFIQSMPLDMNGETILSSCMLPDLRYSGKMTVLLIDYRYTALKAEKMHYKERGEVSGDYERFLT